jgi:hypothetical protein
MTPISDKFIKYTSTLLENDAVYEKLSKALSKRLYNYLIKSKRKVRLISRQRLLFGKGEYGDKIFDEPLEVLAKMEHEEAIDYMHYVLIELFKRKLTKPIPSS